MAACTNAFAPEAPAPFLTGAASPLVFTAAASKARVTAGDTASLIFTLPRKSNIVRTPPSPPVARLSVKLLPVI